MTLYQLPNSWVDHFSLPPGKKFVKIFRTKQSVILCEIGIYVPHCLDKDILQFSTVVHIVRCYLWKNLNYVSWPNQLKQITSKSFLLSIVIWEFYDNNEMEIQLTINFFCLLYLNEFISIYFQITMMSCQIQSLV